MSVEDLILQVVGFLFYILLIVVFFRVWKRSRHYNFREDIRRTAENKGWEDISIQWAPLARKPFPYAFWSGRTWFSYYVTYRDVDGAYRYAFCHVFPIRGPIFYPMD